MRSGTRMTNGGGGDRSRRGGAGMRRGAWVRNSPERVALKTPKPMRPANAFSCSPNNSQGSGSPGPVGPTPPNPAASPPILHSSTPELWPQAVAATSWPEIPNGYAAGPNGEMLAGQGLERAVWGEYGEQYPDGVPQDSMPPSWSAKPAPPLWDHDMQGMAGWAPPLPPHSEQFPSWGQPLNPAVPPGPWAEMDEMNARGGWSGQATSSANSHEDGDTEGKRGGGRGKGKRRRGPRNERQERATVAAQAVPAVVHGGRLSWVGRILTLAREPNTSRMMQKELRESAGMVEGLVTRVVEEIAPGFAMLMGDPVGNYFCQALLDVTPKRELEILVHSVAGSLVDIALSRHGTCAVQRLIHATIERSPELATVLTQGLQKSVVALTNDLHGHYVIQCCLDALEPADSAFILEAMRGHCAVVASHRQGCLVLQKCFDRALDDHLVALAEEIGGSAADLAQDPFGNYVVQHVLRKCPNHWVQKVIASNLIPHLVLLSSQKFSSNVVELCFSVADEETREMMVRRLTGDPEGLGKIAKDQFGNYVIQSILSSSSPDQVERLIEKMRPALQELEQTQTGRRVLANLKKKCRVLAAAPAAR